MHWLIYYQYWLNEDEYDLKALVENTLQSLHNSSYHTNAKSNNWSVLLIAKFFIQNISKFKTFLPLRYVPVFKTFDSYPAIPAYHPSSVGIFVYSCRL